MNAIPDRLTPHEALIGAMLFMAASGAHVDDAEIGKMTRLVRELPAFAGVDAQEVAAATEACLPLLAATDGVDRAIDLIHDALPPRLRETAYLLACEIAAADGEATQEELVFLQQLRIGLELDRLVAGAIERAARARYQLV
ncbi:tellurite resistance TerB family protein [Roseococcus sp. DSY-14]|uniref:tellurite resistance TerB family protein n=1 Tax=Roseococcus sp. DSY-14 TaxID=3369650 RepID=UPI00387ABCDC